MITSLATIGLTSNQAFAGVGPGEFPNHLALPTNNGIGDFRCWNFFIGEEPSGPLLFQRDAIISVEDQFGLTENIQVGNGVEFCASAIKNGDPGPFGTTQHFIGYDRSFNEPIVPQTNTWFIPQFDFTIPDLIVSQPVELLVPTSKHPTAGSELSPNLTDLHYNCYDASQRGIFLNQLVTLETQFGEVQDFIGELYIVCNPAIKFDSPWTEGAGPFFGALVPQHLVCFLISSAGDDFGTFLLFDNQFTYGIQDNAEIETPHKVCFEALKDPPLIGGTLIPIDKTSLLLAGAQMTASWLIPVIVTGAGIGLFVFSRKSENS